MRVQPSLLQHTPVIPAACRSGIKIHDEGSHLTEQGPLKWFGEVVGHHLGSWAVGNGEIATLDAIGDEEVTNIQMARPLAA